MDEYIENIDSMLVQFGLPSSSEIPKKTIQRIIDFERYAGNVELQNDMAIEGLKKRKMTKLSVSKSDEVNVSRKTLYNDKILLKYVESRIKIQPDYLNEKKIKRLQDHNQELKSQYDKITDHLLDTSILQAEILQHQEKIEELTQDKNRLYMALQKYEK